MNKSIEKLVKNISPTPQTYKEIKESAKIGNIIIKFVLNKEV